MSRKDSRNIQKSWILSRQLLESLARLLILTPSVANFLWLHHACAKYFPVYCLLEAFQNMDLFQRNTGQIWSVPTNFFHLDFDHWIILKILLNYSNNFCGQMSKFQTKLDAYSLWFWRSCIVIHCRLTRECWLRMRSYVISDCLRHLFKIAFRTDFVNSYSWM